MTHRRKFQLRLPSGPLRLGEKTLIMGVLNVTPDSFSDGGEFLDSDSAVARALEMERDGANIIDIGAESTRPGAKPLAEREELERLLPVLEKLSGKLKVPISVDTQKAGVAQAAASAGAQIINDISALRFDPRMGELVSQHKLGIILMHMRGRPRSMQRGPFARDVMRDIISGLHDALHRAKQAGIARGQILIDPGIGFGKSFDQNFAVLARLSKLKELGCPIVVGASRKAFLGDALGKVPANARLWGTAATVAASILNGAHVVRIHDVREMAQLARITDRVAAGE